MPGAVHDVIKPANFCDDRLRGFGVARGRILAFSIDLLRRLYNSRTTVRVCDTCFVKMFTLCASASRRSPHWSRRSEKHLLRSWFTYDKQSVIIREAERSWCDYLRHPCSSDPSWQSKSPSHVHACSAHSPSPHVNRLSGHGATVDAATQQCQRTISHLKSFFNNV